MRTQLQLIDMRLNDKYIYACLLGIAAHGQTGRLNMSDLAAEIGCHRNTVSRAYHRLEAAGMIKTVGGGRKTGYEYKVIRHE
jgi:DNA-binding IscR family transcriptional regulator